MKKLLALFLILLLMLSAFGCAKPDEETGAEAGLVDTPAPQPEKKPEPEQEPVTKEPTPDLQTKEPEKEEPETEEPQPTGDKAPFCDVKIDEPFSSSEVVVSLTLEESKKGIEYTEKDFAEYGVINVFPFDYYPEKYFPEYKDRQTLILMLDKDSKQNVLDSVKKLEQDERVYSCEPNFEYNQNKSPKDTGYIPLYMILTDEESKLNKKYILDDFDVISKNHTPYINNFKHLIYTGPSEFLDKVIIYNYERVFFVVVERYEDIKTLVEDSRVERVYYVNQYQMEYDEKEIIVRLTHEQFDVQQEYTISDFSYLDLDYIEKLKQLDKDASALETELRLYLKTPSKRELLNAYYLLEKDPRIAEVYIENKDKRVLETDI